MFTHSGLLVHNTILKLQLVNSAIRCFMFIDLPCAAGHQDCWRWLQGDFHLIHIVDGLCNAISKDKWKGWLASNDLKVNLMNQLVAHCVCRVPITRQQKVPGSDAAGAIVTWQDLENDGVAYIGEPGMQSSPLDFAKWPTSSGLQLIFFCLNLA